MLSARRTNVVCADAQTANDLFGLSREEVFGLGFRRQFTEAFQIGRQMVRSEVRTTLRHSRDSQPTHARQREQLRFAFGYKRNITKRMTPLGQFERRR